MDSASRTGLWRAARQRLELFRQEAGLAGAGARAAKGARAAVAAAAAAVAAAAVPHQAPRRGRRKRRRKIDVTAAGPVRTISEKRRRIKTKRRKTGKRTKRGRRRKTETVGVGRIPRSEAVPTLIAGQRLAAAVLEVALGIEREETATGLESEIAATTSASEAARAHPDHGGRRIGVDALLPEAATAIVAAIVSASATEEEARVTAKIGTDVNHEGPHLQRCALAVRARALVGPKGNDRRQRSGRHPGSALHLESGLLPRRSAHPPASAHLPGGAALQEEVAHLRRSPLR
mmetsp:Transcript_115101/g.210773  ORF Transcript_115101/g.210773 Transcript_115101/m.210773 type:complete len:290 (-) Transcript_115101:3871-4740(-)